MTNRERKIWLDMMKERQQQEQEQASRSRGKSGGGRVPKVR